MPLARLTRREDFEAVLAQGRRKGSRNFSVRARDNGGNEARLGLVASRKAAPRAVDRNRCKRIARETFRSLSAGLPAVDIVIQMRTDLKGVTSAAIREELSMLLLAVATGTSR